ncbi:hypothetical protein BH10CYA1_BH10CYA1_18050 [soil metagenome]
MASQLVLLLNEGPGKTRDPAVRGGKGASLVELVELGLAVPAAFTISTSVARAFAQEGKLPKRLTWQLDRAIKAIEAESEKSLGAIKNPLLVSIRSGAAVSMPGMMDTILNVGLNDLTVESVAEQFGERFAFDSYRRLLSMFGQTVLGLEKQSFAEALTVTKSLENVEEDRQLSPIALRALCEVYKEIIAAAGKVFPQDVFEQLTLSIFAVLQSWNSPRAVVYRESQNIPHWWGTAVTVQCMVFGNRSEDSGTGVVFSRNPVTGEPGMYGEFLPNAQGEDVVAGIRTPINIDALRVWNNRVYVELEAAVQALEAHFNDIVDVEYTVEQGKLFILQCRSAKRTAQAAATFAVHSAWQGRWNRREAIERVTAEQVSQLTRRGFKADCAETAPLFTAGLPASPGAAVGKAVFTSEKAVALANAGENVILIRPDTSPDDLPGMLVSRALVTHDGGTTSHAAVVARGLGIPAVVGCLSLRAERHAAQSDAGIIKEGDIVAVDGTTGKVFLGEIPYTEAILTNEVKTFLTWLKRFGAGKMPQAKIDFAAFSKELDPNTALNDFYIIDAMAQAATGNLSAEIVKLRSTMHSKMAEVFACYLMVAVISELGFTESETRHSKLSTAQQEAWTNLKGWLKISAYSYQDSMTIMATTSLSEQIEFFRQAECVFSANWGVGYGGPKWAAIARAPLEFLSGRLNHTAFVDHVFDLKHNGGPVFGKHEMISGDMHTLHAQLNIKKSTTSVNDLHTKLLKMHSAISTEVSSLYERGRQQGLW